MFKEIKGFLTQFLSQSGAPKADAFLKHLAGWERSKLTPAIAQERWKVASGGFGIKETVAKFPWAASVHKKHPWAKKITDPISFKFIFRSLRLSVSSYKDLPRRHPAIATQLRAYLKKEFEDDKEALERNKGMSPHKVFVERLSMKHPVAGGTVRTTEQLNKGIAGIEKMADIMLAVCDLALTIGTGGSSKFLLAVAGLGTALDVTAKLLPDNGEAKKLVVRINYAVKLANLAGGMKGDFMKLGHTKAWKDVALLLKMSKRIVDTSLKIVKSEYKLAGDPKDKRFLEQVANVRRSSKVFDTSLKVLLQLMDKSADMDKSGNW